jgi:hypothetical protein
MRNASVLLLIGFVVTGCERAQPAGRTVTDEEAASTGAETARSLREGLVRRLTAALDSAGPAGAIEVCAIEAMPLADSITRAAGNGITVRRTSDRVRNPANSPDEGDLEMLAMFEADLAAGRPLPGHRLQSAGSDTVRYYEPLRIMPLCVQCHGPAGEMDADVRRVLAERYPQDAAVGYREGDFRGLIRVSIPRRPGATR